MARQDRAARLSSKSNIGEDGQHVHHGQQIQKVYVRLRPMNKLEISRRSKDCVELDDVNPKIATIDSPHHGELHYSFDMVRSNEWRCWCGVGKENVVHFSR